MKLLRFLFLFLFLSLSALLCFFKPLFLRLSWNRAKKLEKLVEVAEAQSGRSKVCDPPKTIAMQCWWECNREFGSTLFHFQKDKKARGGKQSVKC